MLRTPVLLSYVALPPLPDVLRVMDALALALVKYKLLLSVTAPVFRVCHVLSPRQYCVFVPADILSCLLLKVLQSCDESAPLALDDAFGRLNVCTEPLEVMAKSLPDVPVLNVCAFGVNPFNVKDVVL